MRFQFSKKKTALTEISVVKWNQVLPLVVFLYLTMFKKNINQKIMLKSVNRMKLLFFIPNTLYFLHFCIWFRPFEGRAT